VSTAAAITTVGSAKSSHFVPEEMFTSRATMTTPAKDPYLINKIIFLHNLI
jgi:hypothetical protein